MCARGEEEGGLVEEAMAEARTYQYAQEDIEKERVKLLVAIFVLLVEPLHEQVGQYKARQPAQGEKGFIRAEVIKYDDYIQYGSEAAVREAGKLGIEGKEYVVQDGDIMHFRFNV